MQTYSHFILTAALNGRYAPHLRAAVDKLPPLRSAPLLLGSVLPDLPLIAISIYAIAYDALTGAFANADFSAAPPGAPAPQELIDASMTMRLFEVWFFEDPWVIIAQNTFHSPLLVAFFMLAGWWGWRNGRRWGSTVFWLSTAAMLHALIDIPLHVTDGPLVFFPLNWTYRFRSAVSYWDPNYYGVEWSIFEHLLDVALLVYLFIHYRPSWREWRERRQAPRINSE